MSVAVVVDPGDPTPTYEQLRRQLALHIRSGVLSAGTRLAPVRQLAVDLDLAPGTVARAYRELGASGLVVSRRGAGTRVADTISQAPPLAHIANLADGYLAATRALGIDDATARSAVAERSKADGHEPDAPVAPA